MDVCVVFSLPRYALEWLGLQLNQHGLEGDSHFDDRILDRRIQQWLITSGGITIVGSRISQMVDYLEGEVEVTETVTIEEGPAYTETIRRGAREDLIIF